MRRYPYADGDVYAIWLRDEQETVIRRVFWDDRPTQRNSVRLQPLHPYAEPYYTSPANMAVQGRVLCVIRDYEGGGFL